ncbi:hypothetical protein DsansV1_C04g0045091 [Dioscorea sansibarensis]
MEYYRFSVSVYQRGTAKRDGERAKMAGALVSQEALNPSLVKALVMAMALAFSPSRPISSAPLSTGTLLRLSAATPRRHAQFALAIAPPSLSSPSLKMAIVSSFLREDCVKLDPEVNEEMEKSFIELLMEELKLREA